MNPARQIRRDKIERMSPADRFSGPVIDLYPAFEPPAVEQRTAPAERRRRVPIALWFAMALLALLIALLAFRNPIAEAVPTAAEAYAAIGIPAAPALPEIGGVELVRVYGGGAVSVTIEGEIVNETGRQAAVPSIEFALRDAAGATVESWSIASPRRVLDPGARTRFATEIAALPVEARDLAITIGGNSRIVVTLD